MKMQATVLTLHKKCVLKCMRHLFGCYVIISFQNILIITKKNVGEKKSVCDAVQWNFIKIEEKCILECFSVDSI